MLFSLVDYDRGERVQVEGRVQVDQAWRTGNRQCLHKYLRQ